MPIRGSGETVDDGVKKNGLLFVLCVAVAGMMLAETVAVCADDTASRFSVGHAPFTMAAPDPKSPAPSVLGARYGFGGSGVVPYLGTGIAYTLLPEMKPGDPIKLRTGVAAQAGASYRVGGSFSLSLDYKYLYIPADIQHGEPPPQSIGIGVNIKF